MRQTPGVVELYVSLNAGADFHATGQIFRFYKQPVLLRTGCLGATKGCLTTGPTIGNNPVQVHGIDLNVFVDYTAARCRFRVDGSDDNTGVYFGRIAMHADGAFLGTGLGNGSITADGSSLYCVTPSADVDEKIVTQVAVALNGVDFVEALDEASQLSSQVTTPHERIQHPCVAE